MPDAAALDAADPLGRYRELFVPAPVAAYLDGNSLGRPLRASAERIASAVDEWSTRLIRGWDEGWLDLPLELGDRIGRAALGAAPGQVVVGDSTTVLLYKLIRAALRLDATRDEIVLSRDEFPTDRFALEGIADERGATLRWIESGDPGPDAVGPLLDDRTALVVLSHVNYRSGGIVDAEAVTALAHDAGASVLWDLSHSAGSVPVALDDWGADFAVGCGYKYLNGGPGAPAFGYVAHRHLPELSQPIQGWLGTESPFEMGQGYRPAPGIRRVLSGTPPVLGMQALGPAIDLIDEVGIDAIRTKSTALTSFAIELADALVPDAVLATPRDPRRRGGHITLDHPRFESIMPRLWDRGVIPDFRRPTGIRLGLSPLSTSFAEVEVGVRAIADVLSMP